MVSSTAPAADEQSVRSVVAAAVMDRPDHGVKFSDASVSDVGGGEAAGSGAAGEGDDGSEIYSPSSVSTVSSSGEVGGVYTLYSDMVHSEEEQELSGKF